MERPADQPELTAKAAATRSAILDAAFACDLRALVALGGDNFSTSFGDNRPLADLRRGEQTGDGNLAMLVGLLSLPPTESQYTKNHTYFTWPALYTQDVADWSRADIQALRPLYADSSMSFDKLVVSWKKSGSYLGWRTGITDGGDWLFYIAGD